MSFKITPKSLPKNEYSKVYLKLVALEFTPEIPFKVLGSIRGKEA